MANFNFEPNLSKLDERSVLVNATLKLIYEKHGGNLDATIVDAIIYYNEAARIIHNMYELIEYELPLFAYYILKTKGAENYGFSETEYATAINNTIMACRDYYGDPVPNEYVLCSAINYNGVIISGKRHSDCYDTLYGILGTREVADSPERDQQGFLTSESRYVDRMEGWAIAKKNNQIKFGLALCDIGPESILISENLY